MLGVSRETLYRDLRYLTTYLVALSLVPLAGNEYLVHVMILTFIYTILASGLDLLVGYTGSLILGYAGFYAIGAYVSTLLVMKTGLSPWAGMVAGGLVSMVSGLVFAVPALRLRGPYLAISSLGFGVIVYLMLTNLVDITRGPLGIPGIPPLPGVGPIDFSEREHFYYLALALSTGLVYMTRIISVSRYGRVLVAIREDEDAARSIGVDVSLYRVTVFMISSLVAGVAGALYAHYMRYINPEISSLGTSITILSMVILGGAGSIVGPVAGAYIVMFFSEILRPLLEYRFLIYGAMIMLIIRFVPGGLYSVFNRVLYREVS